MFKDNLKLFMVYVLLALLVLAGCAEQDKQEKDILNELTAQETKNPASSNVNSLEDLIQLRPMDIGHGDGTLCSIPKMGYSPIGAVAA